VRMKENFDGGRLSYRSPIVYLTIPPPIFSLVLSMCDRTISSYDKKCSRLARLTLLSGFSRSIVAHVEQIERLVTSIIEFLGIAQVKHLIYSFVTVKAL